MSTSSRISQHLTFANVAAGLAVVIALSGTSYAAVMVTGKDIKNSSVTGKDVKNASLSGKDVRAGSLLAANFKSGQLPAGPPGETGAQGPGAIMINTTLTSGGEDTLTLGPYRLLLSCQGASGHRNLLLAPLGPGDAVVQLDLRTSRDDSAPAVVQGGTFLDPSSVIAWIGRPHPLDEDTTGHFFRASGNLVLHSSSNVTTVVFDMFLDDRGGIGTCALRGTATPST